MAPRNKDGKTQEEETGNNLPPACVVVVNSHLPDIVGRNFDFGDEGLTIGRSLSNRLVIPDHSVSRKHCTIQVVQGRAVLRDLGSANGTGVNGLKVKNAEHPLKHEDRIAIGGTELVFLQGADLEALRKQTVDRLSAVDAFSGAFKEEAFVEKVEKQISRSDRERIPLCLSLIRIDGLDRFREDLGPDVGELVLKEFSTLMKGRVRRHDVFGRLGENLLGVATVDVALPFARMLAERLRQDVEAHAFEFEGRRLPVTVSIGVAQYPFSGDFSSLRLAAKAALIHAEDAGRNCVWPKDLEEQSLVTAAFLRGLGEVQDGDLVIQQALSMDPVGSLVGFEIEHDDLLSRSLSSLEREQWMRELEEDVLENTEFDEPVGVWLDRYAIAALRSGRTRHPEDTVREVVQRWCARPVPDKLKGLVERKLRALLLPSREVDRLKQDTLLELASRLLEQRGLGGVRVPFAGWPFPLAAPLALVSLRSPGRARVQTMMDAVDWMMRFVVAVELAMARDMPVARDDLAAILTGYQQETMALERWTRLAWQCSAISRGEPGAVSSLSRALVREDGQPTELAQRIEEAARDQPTRSDWTQDAATCLKLEERWRALLDDLVDAFGPLAGVRLISMQEMVEFDESSGIGTYDLFHHQGPAELFPVAREKIATVIGYKGWCYLLDHERQKPLLLAPMVAMKRCTACQRNELFVAKQLVIGPPGSSIPLQGVINRHEIRLEIPDLRSLRVLHEAVASRRS